MPFSVNFVVKSLLSAFTQTQKAPVALFIYLLQFNGSTRKYREKGMEACHEDDPQMDEMSPRPHTMQIS